MAYLLVEEDYHYIPEPEDADENFDPVVWNRKDEKEVANLKDVFYALSAFCDVWKDVKISYCENDRIILTSGASSEKSNHPEHYYTQRHSITATWEE